MYKNKKIGLVIRAHNEENFISGVVTALPVFIDRVYLVNDASTDRTLEIINNFSKQDGRIKVVNHNIRRGAGYAAISGQKQALAENNDIIVMLDGDGQMDTTLLPAFLDPLCSGEADYVKGNRFSCKEHLRGMSGWRIFGNRILTILNRISSGYWKLSDPQNGYAAVTRSTLQKLDLDIMNKGFAYENDMLVKLNVIGAKVVEIAHPAIYKGQLSKIRYSQFIFQTSGLLLIDFFWRIRKKYL